MVKSEQIFTMICSSMIMFAALIMIGKFGNLNALSGFSSNALAMLVTKSNHSRSETNYTKMCMKNSNNITQKQKGAVTSRVMSVLKSPLILLGRFFHLIPQLDKQMKSTPAKNPTQSQVNDHLYIDSKLLTTTQKAMIDEVTSSKIFKSETLRKLGRQTGIEMNDFLVYRYFAAADWAPTYHGKKVEAAIEDTIKWRSSFGVHKMARTTLRPLLESGLSYVSPMTDKHGRSLVYIYIAKNIPIDPNILVKYLMYTVERADRQCQVGKGNGEFVVVVDLQDFSFSNCPNMNAIKSAMGLLKSHYPHRFAGMFILNTNSVFKLIWNILRPLVPKKALAKVHVLGKGQNHAFLEKHLGLAKLDRAVGGTIVHSFGTDNAYFSSGYWKSD